MARVYLRLQLTFTHEDDIKAYGGPYLYDEYAIVGMSGRDLADLESQIGMPIVDVMNGVRLSSSMADLAAAWLAMELDPHTEAPAFSEFSPHTLMIEWERAPEVEAGKDSASQVADPMPEQADPRPVSAVISLPSLPRAD